MLSFFFHEKNVLWKLLILPHPHYDRENILIFKFLNLIQVLSYIIFSQISKYIISNRSIIANSIIFYNC